MRPSFIYHQISAIIGTIGTILALYYLYQQRTKINTSGVTVIVLLIAIFWGVHSILHFYEEIYFDFNPMRNKTKVYDKPIRH